MRSATPKVLHEILGRTLLEWVVGAVLDVGAERTVVVVPPGADQIRARLPAGAEAVTQERPTPRVRPEARSRASPATSSS